MNNELTTLEAFTRLSDRFKLEKFTEFERVMVKFFYNLLSEVIELSSLGLINPKLNKDNVLVMANNIILEEYKYSVKEHIDGGIEVEILYAMPVDTVIITRPKDKTLELFDSINKILNDNEYTHRIETPETFDIGVSEAEISEETYNIITSSFDDDDIVDIKNDLDFSDNIDGGKPPELIELSLKESLIMTSLNQKHILSPHGYETFPNVGRFPAVMFDYDDATHNGEYPIELGTINPEQVLVLVNNDDWALDIHYTLSIDKITFIKKPFEGQKVIITDRLSAFDQYNDLILDNMKNLNIGGFDGNIVLPDYLKVDDDIREFTVYGNGNTYHFRSISHSLIEGSLDENTKTITTSTNLSDMNFPNDGKRLLAIYAEKTGIIDGRHVKLESSTEFVYATSYKNKIIKLSNRGVINSQARIFDNTKYTKIEIHNLSVGKELSAMLITEPYIGNRRNNYPKYGHIVTGKD